MALAFLVGWCLPGAMTANAAANKDQKKERQALRRMQQQLTEIQQQKSSVDQEKLALEETLKKTSSETEAHKRSAARAAARISRLEMNMEAAGKEKTELHAKLDEASKQNQELLARHKQLEQNLKDKEAALERQNELRKQCEENNDKLYRIGRELVDWYSSKGSWSAVLEAEPFTRIKSVEMENLMEKYRDDLEAKHLQSIYR
jgi:chromosome segregation ATPase